MQDISNSNLKLGDIKQAEVTQFINDKAWA